MCRAVGSEDEQGPLEPVGQCVTGKTTISVGSMPCGA